MREWKLICTNGWYNSCHFCVECKVWLAEKTSNPCRQSRYQSGESQVVCLEELYVGTYVLDCVTQTIKGTTGAILKLEFQNSDAWIFETCIRLSSSHINTQTMCLLPSAL